MNTETERIGHACDAVNIAQPVIGIGVRERRGTAEAEEIGSIEMGNSMFFG